MGLKRASEYYFSASMRSDLTLPEAALLAALPKGPESYSPMRHPERALRRRNLVLSEMLQDGKITASRRKRRRRRRWGCRSSRRRIRVAPYFVEEVRRQLEREYGAEEVHGAGLKVYTTLDLDLQTVANKAVLDGTAAYERRHGWKGKLQNVLLDGDGPGQLSASGLDAADRAGRLFPCAGDGCVDGEGDGEDRRAAGGVTRGGLGVDAEGQRRRAFRAGRHGVRAAG